MEEAEEGKVATRLHRYRERDRRLVAEAKAQALKKHGRLFCSACGFDFYQKYGEVGTNLIDVHHTKPVHTLGPGETTKVVDLVLLCSNCHRVVHSRRKWLTIDQVKAAMTSSELGDDG
ncbi:MAG TPA: HNH endonuclease [Achromobacter sp.]|nr:HNH endonuclease [Achromobacter sp.]